MYVNNVHDDGGKFNVHVRRGTAIGTMARRRESLPNVTILCWKRRRNGPNVS